MPEVQHASPDGRGRLRSSEDTLDARFEAQVDRSPDATAVEHGSVTLSYRELDVRANRLARHLRDLGVDRGTLVGLFVDRTPTMIVAMLAIVKAGGAYVPLDPSYPLERITMMIDDADPRVVLGSAGELARLSPGGRPTVDLADPSRFDHLADARLALPWSATDVAYVMYTSGSTGRPKGACIPHRAVAALASESRYVALRQGDRVGQASNASFDAATFEIWSTLLNGATAVIVDRETVLDVTLYADAIAGLRLTTLFVTTALFNQIAEQRPQSFAGLDTLLFGGEVARGSAIRQVLTRAPRRLVHVYGPTETTTFATWFLVESVPDGAATVPIGQPLTTTTAHVLDGSMQPVVGDAIGELFLGGAGNAHGYWRRPALTAERFVPDPFSERPGATLYRTGDLVKRRPDGDLEFLGRVDNQVKVRGYRVELGEIESVLSRAPGVHEAVVLARDDGGAEKRLVAYVVPESTATLEPAGLSAAVRTFLPEYMVPGAFVILPALPLNANGKVDRRALPAPDDSAFVRAAYVAPRTPTEQLLAAIFREVIGVTDVGLHDDFFALGGQSLDAMRVAARLRRERGITVTVRSLFEAPTLEAFARHVESCATTDDAPIALVDRGAPLVVSRLQERLVFLEKLEAGSNAYVIFAATRLRGPLRVDVLERACNEIVKRHESLRTTFDEKDGVVAQIVQPARPVKLARQDLKRVPPAERERVLLESARREATARFDLKRGPLLRLKLLALADDEHVLLLAVHHIVFDGWSLGVFASELETLYAAFAGGRESPLAPLSVQYADIAAWERAQQSERGLAEQLAYWKESLAGAPAVLELPADRPRPASPQHRGAVVHGAIGPRVTERLRRVGRAQGATLYMTLLATLGALLGRLSGQRDVVVATPVVNRARPETEKVIGFFMNTVAVRVPLDQAPTFLDVVARAREASLGALANQDVPFDRVVQELNPVRDLRWNPLAQVSLNFLDLPDLRLRLQGVSSEPVPGATVGSKFDFTLYVAEREGLQLELVYDPDRFDEARMLRLLASFTLLAERFGERPGDRIDDVSLVSEEQRLLLPDPRVPLPLAPFHPIATAFATHAARDGARVAVSDGHRSWTYAELAARTDDVAAWLAAQDVRPGDVVAIHADKSALAVSALLGVVKSGAAFTVLDAEYPAARLVEQVRLARPKAWLSASEQQACPDELVRVLPGGARRLDLGDRAGGAANAARPTVVESKPDDLAYVAFTSGTTGGPKAIAATHAPLAHFVQWHARTHALGVADRFSALSGLAHDPFLRDVFTPLSIGASVHFPPAGSQLEPEALTTWLARERITVAHLTPSLGEVIALARRASLPDLRLVCFAGEALRGELVETLRQLAPAASFVSFYGATETPQAMAAQNIAPAATGRVPAGRGIEGVQLLVVTAGGMLAAVDEEGEIWVRTPYLALGYLDSPAGGFGANPFTGDPADRVYRTGDRGRYLADGTVEVLGRTDDQVKVRGFRVELGDVVAALRRQAGVEQAAVIVDERQQSLVAYVVGAVDPAALGTALRRDLPAFMVPSRIVLLEALPLTANGKLDRRALPAPPAPIVDAAADGAESETEAGVAAVWREVLDVEHVGRSDNFFDLGGHSLLATRLATQLGEEFGVPVTVRMIFEAPTVAELAERIMGLILETSSPENLAAAMRDLE